MNNTSESDRALQNHNRQKRNAKEIFLSELQAMLYSCQCGFFFPLEFWQKRTGFSCLENSVGAARYADNLLSNLYLMYAMCWVFFPQKKSNYTQTNEKNQVQHFSFC